MSTESECTQEESRSGEQHLSPVSFSSALIKSTLGFQIVRNDAFLTGGEADERLKKGKQ